MSPEHSANRPTCDAAPASAKGSAPVPVHVAIIMDGNGRWAQQRGMHRLMGHQQGAETVRRTLRAARELGVHMVTLFAFSVENWRRPAAEIEGLWSLLETFLNRYLAELQRDEVRLRWLGRREGLPGHLHDRLAKAEADTRHFTRYACNLALNYGSRTEVVDAAQAWARDVLAGKSAPEGLDWELFSSYLYTGGLPDPDLLIRTSGESRISNFLLLQLAYAELHFTPKLWPDFTEEDFALAIQDFQGRQRRYGKTGQQLELDDPTS